MKDTLIEWCDSTVNPTGFQCQGCELWIPAQDVKECYAGKFAERIGGIGAFDKPVELKPGRMAEAARWSDLRGKPRPNKPWIPVEYPRIIFIGDMADTLQSAVPFTYLFDEVIQNVTSEHGRRHIWMWLTKDAKRLAGFVNWMADGPLKGAGNPWPKNLWPGVSVTSNKTTWRIEHLLKVPSDRNFISYEPAWEYVDFSKWMFDFPKDEDGFKGCEPSYKISQIIIGGESGAGAKLHPFNVAWARQLLDDCEDSRVACFVKQMGVNVVGVDKFAPGWKFNLNGSLRLNGKGGDWSEWSADIAVREFPELP